jgi:hypothetical protein
MSDLLLIPLCISAGILLSKIRSFPEKSYRVINSIIIYVCLPALTLYYIPQIQIKKDLIFPAVIIWIIFPVGILFFVLLEKLFKWDKRTTGALILTGGLANTSFVGFPVLVSLFGEDGLKIGVIIDQAGSFLVLSTLGVIVASVFSKGSFSLKIIAMDIIKYPPFIAFIISILMIVLDFKHNDVLSSLLQKVGFPTIFLALISVGMQIKFKMENIIWKELASGIIFKLLFAPAIIFFICYFFLNTSSLANKVSIIESAMPPMVMGSVLASQFELNPKLANLMVGIGIPLSAVTLVFWYWVVS